LSVVCIVFCVFLVYKYKRILIDHIRISSRMFSRYFSKFSRLSATIFLIVFNGFVNSAGYSTIGGGRNTIENGTVTLANGSRIATREDVDEYYEQPRACSVEIDAETNM